MGRWVAKSLVHRLLFWLPGGRRVANLLRRSSTRLDPAGFLEAVSSAQRHRRAGSGDRKGGPKRVLEIGTGWNPVQPVAHFLCGADRVDTWDIESLVSPESWRRVVGFFLNPALTESWQARLPDWDSSRWRHLQKLSVELLSRPPREGLAQLNIHLHFGFPKSLEGADPYDLSFSHSVLQYFAPAELARLLHRLHQLAAPGGVTSHWISLADQFARFDPSISPYNFLRFSDATWRWLDSPLIPLNRLRCSEYVRAFSEAGWSCRQAEKLPGPPLDREWRRLASRFRSMDPADVQVVGHWWQGERGSKG